MPKPVHEWGEDDVLSLPLEDDTFERKGTRLLDLTLPGVSEDAVRDELAKQLSAFANTGGGRIIYGLTDAGEIDAGGVSTNVKGRRSTKEWLDDLIPSLTDYEIVGVNVYEITAKTQGSAIQPEKAIYVVDVPDSERVPHQSRRGLLYYVRLGGRSQPASHRLIEDIRNRARHPNLNLSRSELIGIQLSRDSLPRVVGILTLAIRFSLANVGRVKAANVCLLTEGVAPGSNFGAPDRHIYDIRAGQAAGTIFWELKHPIYPEMVSTFVVNWRFPAELIGFVQGTSSTFVLPGTRQDVEQCALSWKIFADSAPPKSGRLTLADLEFSRKGVEALARDAAWQRIKEHYYPGK